MVMIFVRHGQTKLNLEQRLQGRIDQSLTDLGREQARLVAAALARSQDGLAEKGEALAGPVIAEVLTSPLSRASETARLIADAIGAELVVDERLIELDYGEWDGRRLLDVTGDEWRQLTGDPTFAPPGGESQAAVAARVADLCSERLTPNSTVVAVSHVAPIKAAVLWALGLGDARRWGLTLSVASTTRIGRRSDGTPFLSGYNDVSHLTASP